MISLNRVFLGLVFAGVLAACGSKPEPEKPAADASAEQPAAEDEAPPAVKSLALIDACKIDMSEPNYREWTTKWDPVFGHNAAENPSGVRSAHWANEEELKYALEGKVAFPFELSCGSKQGEEGAILIEMLAVDSSLTDIPMSSGTYPIKPRSLTGKNAPGDIVVAALNYDGASFEVRSGTLSLNRLNAEGAAGSFVIEGVEAGGEKRPLRLEATFDMPCRLARLQNGCKSDKAERE
jgi:hypothetical protein